MSPKETDNLLSDYSKTAYPIPKDAIVAVDHHHRTMMMDDYDDDDDDPNNIVPKKNILRNSWWIRASIVGLVITVLAVIVIVSSVAMNNNNNDDDSTTTKRMNFFRKKGNNNNSSQQQQLTKNLTGPYQLLEAHYGSSFFDYYDFMDGPDSLGSAGYNRYVGRSRAWELGLWNVSSNSGSDDNDHDDHMDEYVYMKSIVGTGPRDEYGNLFRDSIRLEGKRRFDRGLFILDIVHMPSGCGVWPAFWTTDEAAWPDHGEIDIVEGINTQDVVKTALHTSEGCDMYAHTPRWEWSGHWDVATGIPDRFTGQLNYDTVLQADNCWTMTPHQWENQGCVAVSNENGTIGSAMNDIGGGVYVLEWDDANGYIKSWVFKNGKVPTNLQQSVATANRQQQQQKKQQQQQPQLHKTDPSSSFDDVVPDPSTWGVPYAYFAIGDYSGCPLEHFQNHRLVINLAFCGTVAGNRFARDCPALYEQYNVNNDSVLTCNAYIDSNPTALDEAYWKIKGVYMYERTEYQQP